MLLLNGDCIEQMQKLIDEGVQVESVVTDPPYELGFMGKSWDASGIAFDKKTWELAFQLLKPGGYLLAFSASRNYHRMAVAVEDAGFEIRDQIMWIYGSGFPKSLNIGMGVDKKQGNERVAVGERTRNVKPFDDDNGWNSNNTTGNHIYTKGNTEWEGWGTALKPAHEPIVMARKPLEGTVVDNVLEHGVGGINIDECRVGKEILEEQIAGRSNKIGTFERKDMIESVLNKFQNVEVKIFDSLLIDFAVQENVKIIVRGLRALSDFEYEFQMALMNRKLNDEISTIFMMPHEKYIHISSSLIKEVISLGGDVKDYAPKLVINHVKNKI